MNLRLEDVLLRASYVVCSIIRQKLIKDETFYRARGENSLILSLSCPYLSFFILSSA